MLDIQRISATALQAGAVVISAQLHPTNQCAVLGTSDGAIKVNSLQSGEVLMGFEVDQSKHGPLKSVQFFDASSLLHVSLLPAALVAEARASFVVAVCAKALYVFDCVTMISIVHAPPVLATGPSKANGHGALSGACVAVSCEHVVLGTTFGALFTVSLKDGTVLAFSGVAKVHEKAIVGLVPIAGRPSPQLHRARIVSACQGGFVAAWEVLCETPIHRTEPRVLSRSSGSPVVDIRYESGRNRLACCFANGAVTVWGFDEHSQEETVLMSLSKGSGIQQCAVPRVSWGSAPEDSLLTLSPRGKLVLTLPSAAAVRLAKQLKAGTTSAHSNVSQSDLKSTRGLLNLGAASEHLVAVRTEIDLTAREDFFKGAIVRFWQHPLYPKEFLLLTNDASKSMMCFCRVNYPVPLLQHESLLEAKGVLPLENRLVVRSGQRHTPDRVLAWLSPYSPSSDTLPSAINDFSKADILENDVVKSLDLDSPVEALWPGAMACTALEREEEGALLLGVAWPEAKRVAVLRLSRLGTPQAQVQVLQGPIEGGTCMCFAGLSDGDNQVMLLVGRQRTVVASGSTAVTNSSTGPAIPKRSIPALAAAASLRASKSFRGMTTLSAIPKRPDETSSTVRTNVLEYSVLCYRLGDPIPVSEVKLNQPITALVGRITCDVFLLRADPPQHLVQKATTLRPWSRFYSLPGLIQDKKLVAVGSQLPAPCLWDVCASPSRPDGALFALGLDSARVLVFEAFGGRRAQRAVLRGHVFTRSSERTVCVRWHHGSLFIVTPGEILITFAPFKSSLADSAGFFTFVLAGRGRSAHPGSLSPRGGHDQRRDSLHLHEDSVRLHLGESAYAPAPAFVRPWEEADSDESASFPIPVTRPLPLETLAWGVDRDSGDLLLVSPTGKTWTLPLRHPLVRIGMLASSGLGAIALKWSYALPPSTEARDAAVVLLERLGFALEASQVRGVSAVLLLDLCVRHSLIDRATTLFDARTNAFHDLAKQDEAEGRRTSAPGHLERLALLLASGGKFKELEFMAKRIRDQRARLFCASLAFTAQHTTVQ